MTLSYELGPIRPPSEAQSLLVRVTRNCPWNKCAFCAVYKGTHFERRGEAEVKADIDAMAAAVDAIRDISWRAGFGGEVTAEVAHQVLRSGADEGAKRIAIWLHGGGQTAFLQDADSLCIPPDKLVSILRHLRGRLPSITRVTTYARSRTLASRSVEQLRLVREAGLDRVHVGVESGHDPLLDLIRKGARAEHHIAGGRKAIEAGFELCCYVMPGLGGREYSAGHSRDTAAVLQAVDPHHIRLRSLHIDHPSPLEAMVDQGVITLMSDPEVVREIRDMVARLTGMRSRLVSDHEMNLLMEVEGSLAEGPGPILAILDRFLSMPRKRQDAFVLARRTGWLWRLDQFQGEGN